MNLTSEHFESTNLTVYQPAKGHRYGEASLALAEFVTSAEDAKIAELGSGVGVISLQIAASLKPKRVAAIEIQESLHEIALKNVSENGYSDRIACINDDYRSYARKNISSFDLVVSNPPFYAVGEGRISSDSQRAAARHELYGTLQELVESARILLKPHGRFAVVFLKSRMDELDDEMTRTGFKKVRAGNDLDEIFLAEYEFED